jgi:uncharacterized membrane protein
MTRSVFRSAEAKVAPEPSRASISGHPLHPAVIPLPIGLLTAAFATDTVAQFSEDEFWSRASRYLLAAGLVTGVAAGTLGAIDYYGLERPRELPEGRWHLRGNVAALALTAGNLASRRRRGRVTPRGLALSAAVAGLLGVTSYLGGELSYRHLVGVQPKTGGQEPAVGGTIEESSR